MSKRTATKIIAVKKKTARFSDRISVKKPHQNPEPPAKKPRFFEAVGRRKTAVARVRFFPSGSKEITINEKPLNVYFPSAEFQQIVTAPLEKISDVSEYEVAVKIKGGGVHSQAEAVRHGLARTLVMIDKEIRKKFKKAGFLTRDARMRERKKPGLKRARRAPQWRKR